MDPQIKLMFLNEHAAEGAARFGVSPKELTFIGGFQNFIYSYMKGDSKYILRFRLHELSKRYNPTLRRHTWKSNEYLLQAKNVLPSEHQPILQALDELKAQLAVLPASEDQFGLIHGDNNVGNFMVDEAGGITLFDFDECQYSWYVEDIAVQLYYLLYVFGEDSKSERKAQYELFVKHFVRGYTENGRTMPDGWKDHLPLFLRLREIIVFVGMHRSWDLREPDDWTRDFLQDSRMRITKGISLIDEFF